MGDYTYTSAGFMLTSGYLDTSVDIEPGRAVAATPSGQNTFKGQLGKVLRIDDKEAAELSSAPSTLTLYGGDYQYVRMTTSITQAAAIGAPIFWSDPTKFLVTTDNSATDIYLLAGICLGTGPAANNYFFIQVSGLASVLYKSSPTSTTLPNSVITISGANNFDSIATASLTIAQQQLKVAQAFDQPVTAAVKRAWLMPAGGALQRTF